MDVLRSSSSSYTTTYNSTSSHAIAGDTRSLSVYTDDKNSDRNKNSIMALEQGKQYGIVHVACGGAHTLAIDDQGNLLVSACV
jgi:alpha-tubulin suppressor-like RCC1 family protein